VQNLTAQRPITKLAQARNNNRNNNNWSNSGRTVPSRRWKSRCRCRMMRDLHLIDRYKENGFCLLVSGSSDVLPERMHSYEASLRGYLWCGLQAIWALLAALSKACFTSILLLRLHLFVPMPFASVIVRFFQRHTYYFFSVCLLSQKVSRVRAKQR
jgi:hypothetical protein